MKGRDSELFCSIKAYARDRAGPEPESCLYWLQDGDHGEVFCRACVKAIPMLPGLAVCHLLHLLGEPIGQPRQHLTSDGCCERCNTYGSRGKCLSVPAEIVANADEQTDGGWRDEEDSLRHCDNECCLQQLSVCLTGWGAFEELRHWEDYGPPSAAGDWYDFTEMLNSIEDEHLPLLAALWTKWDLGRETRQSAAETAQP